MRAARGVIVGMAGEEDRRGRQQQGGARTLHDLLESELPPEALGLHRGRQAGPLAQPVPADQVALGAVREEAHEAAGGITNMGTREEKLGQSPGHVKMRVRRCRQSRWQVTLKIAAYELLQEVQMPLLLPPLQLQISLDPNSPVSDNGGLGVLESLQDRVGPQLRAE